jgi:curved DNA-binding protein CbpA
MSELNLYRILGVPNRATDEEIKQAYLSLVKKYHPDVNRGMEQWANERLKEINEAYETLSNPEKRKQYDDLRITQRSKDIQVRQTPRSIQKKTGRKKAPVVVAKAETVEAKRRRSKTNAIITASAILAVIVAVVVTSWYLIYKAPLQRPIITVNNENIKIEYLLKRCLMNTSSPNDTYGTIQSIVYELLIKQGAPQYGITVTEADIDQALRDEANQSSTDATGEGTTATLSDAEFKEWYRQTLNQTQLSEKEFRDYVRTSIMAQRLQTLLGDNMPTTAEQVHLYDILLPDYNTAAEVKKRIDEGEDFMTIASEVSLDTDTMDNGGDMGWLPIKVLDSSLENTVTNLDIGVVSAPVQTSASQSQAQSTEQEQPYLLLMVTEKAVAREVDAQYIDTLKARLMQDWINTQASTQKVALHGRGSSGGYDSETDAWLQYQIEKLKKSRGIEETTTTASANPITGQ